VNKFRFVIASRFHALVHALKNGVPCIALGWATKYMDLMKLFGQEQYAFDLRERVEISDVENAVAEMSQMWQSESEIIHRTLPDLQRENVFDYIKRI
jgi:colanic acid/amylovoran biosynthesis protein